MKNVKITLYNPLVTIGRLEGQIDIAQKWLDNEVLKDCQPFVPMRTGNLMNSGIHGTKLGSGEVEYNAPYAKKIYYGVHMKFSPLKHPQACALFFEKAKGIHKPKWKDGVQRKLRGG